MTTHIAPATRSVGFWSAVFATVFSLVYIVGQLAEWMGLLGSGGGPDSISTPLGIAVLLTPSLFLGSSFLMLMVSIHQSAPSGRKVWSHAAVVFATVYAVLISTVYFVQLTLVGPRLARGETEGIEPFLFVPFDSFLYAVDILGYSFMSLATLLAANVFTGKGHERTVRFLLTANGLLLPFIALQMYFHPLIWVASLWAITFPASTGALAVLFRPAAKKATGFVPALADGRAFLSRIRSHASSIYFGLAFAISWGGILLVVGPRGIPGTAEQTGTLFPFVYLAMLAGPSLAGLVMTAWVSGRSGLRDLLSGVLRWRVDLHGYAVALLTAPLLLLAVTFALSLVSPIFRPGLFTSSSKAPILAFGIAVGLGAGFFEELGWTGFAIPRLLRRHGLFTTGLLVGVLWGAWHFLAMLWGTSSAAWGTLPPAVVLLVGLFSFLPPYRVIMVWVYERTRSVLVAMVMHASLTTSMLILGPAEISGTTLVTFDLVLAAVAWVLAAVVVGWPRAIFARAAATLSPRSLSGGRRA